MKRYLILNLMVFGIIGCTGIAPLSKENNVTTKKVVNNDNNKTKKTLTIYLDKELQKGSTLRGGNLRGTRVIPIHIEGNDEIILKGTILRKSSRIKIGANDEVSCNDKSENKKSTLRKPNHIGIGENDEVSCRGEDYIIRTSQLKDNDIIIIKYKETKEIRLKIKTL